MAFLSCINHLVSTHPIRAANGQLRKADRAVANTASSYFRWNQAPIDNIVMYLFNKQTKDK